MDPAFTSEVMHTIRFYGVGELPVEDGSDCMLKPNKIEIFIFLKVAFFW